MLYTLHYGTQAAIQQVPFAVLLASAILAAWGVKLYLDYSSEVMYLETKARFNRTALKVAHRLIDRLGLEELSEDECMPETTANGGVRIYLAERSRA